MFKIQVMVNSDCIMKTKCLSILLAVSMSLFCIGLSAQPLRIEHLAGSNTVVFISSGRQGEYLMLPVEESARETSVKVICGNELVRQLNIRLSMNKVDYYVPMSLEEWNGRDVRLMMHSSIDRSNVRDAENELCWSKMFLSANFDKENRERFRPVFHHTPEYGWMNDPNGMFWRDGEWHLYYQYGPYGSMWNNMTWGHSVSRDLIHWEHRAEVLKPDALGAVFSGSCVVDKDNTAGFGNDAVVAMYTSAGDAQTQSLAYSLDGGDSFTKYEGNPILTSGLVDFRDPNLFWNEEIGKWNLILACGQEMRIYTSDNLVEWNEESRFGLGYGSHDGVWECPDLFRLPVEGTDEEKWVLICNINPGGPAGGSATQYFIGDFDGRRFKLLNPDRYMDGKALWQDYGKDHYAAVSFYGAPDGRHTMMAWMSNWDYANNVPTLQYRSANTIVRDPFLYKEGNEIFLGSRPAREYDGAGLDNILKINGSCKIVLTNGAGEEFVIAYDQKAMTLSCDRSRSGLTDFSDHFKEIAVAPVRRKLTSMRIFIDNSSIEVFGNDGEVCLTSLVFPTSPLTGISVTRY